MTSRVMVDAHAHRVRVTKRTVTAGAEGHSVDETTEYVEPHHTIPFFAGNGVSLVIEETKPGDEDFTQAQVPADELKQPEEAVSEEAPRVPLKRGSKSSEGAGSEAAPE